MGYPTLTSRVTATLEILSTGPRDTYQNTLAVVDSLTWIHGKHEIQFGGGFRHDQINTVQGIASNGYFVFSLEPVGNSFASFLSGGPRSLLARWRIFTPRP